MIHIFIGDEIVTVEILPVNPQYPLGTWAVNRKDGRDYWYAVALGTFERFWSTSGGMHQIPPELQVKLLLIGE